ncbi:hypothetical protein BU17DRAFT_46898 [Hysterangium stoloniferum]|nr:hypothetical protein BU17DRAFT_46898 [Hysterangium stoloniferum]
MRTVSSQIAISLFLIWSIPSTIAIWPFTPKSFAINSLIGTGSLGLDANSRVVAFGDLNGDQFTDILMLGTDQQTITPYLWSHDEFLFKPSTSFRYQQPIANIVPGDFNNDGRLDLLVMSQGQTQDETAMAICFSDLHNGFTAPVQIPSSTTLQPILVDANGDMKFDLLGVPMSSNDGRSLKLWKNVWNQTSDTPPVFELTDSTFESDARTCKISQPHSNAFLDFDGDCLADIFLSCTETSDGSQTFQIWLNTPETEGFHLGSTGQLPPGSGRITFADMDRDGTMDMVFPSCSSIDSQGIGRDCMINIAYNKQLPLCSTSSGSQAKRGCRSPDALCTPDPDFQFDLRDIASNDAFTRINFTSLFPSSSLLMSDMTHNPPIPLSIRVGDLSLDGFPDMIIIAASAPRGGILGVGATINYTPYLLNSVPCAPNVAGCDTTGQGRRGFEVAMTGVDALQQITDARGIAVLDIDEDGTLDILVQRSGAQQSGMVTFIRNNFFYDAFFLKAMVLNRHCDGGWCTMSNGTTYQAFGVSCPGATYKYTVQDMSNQRSAAQGSSSFFFLFMLLGLIFPSVAQLPQTSYHSLHTPYSFFGLGRTNNYIENLFVGSTKKDDIFINMEGVIPNSKVIIVPSPAGEKGGWKKELFLRPGAWIPLVTLTVVLSTIILAVIVFILHLNEKREDELERRRASHHINFDAL